MTPVELLARLAAIVPPPRYPLHTYHGVLAPASRWRPRVVPKPRDAANGCAHAGHAASSHETANATATAGGSAAVDGKKDPGPDPLLLPRIARGAVQAVGVRMPRAEPDEDEYSAVIPVERWRQLSDGLLLARAPRIDWPTLLRRCFAEDVLACPMCRGRLQVLDVVAEPDEARKLLEALGIDGGEADPSEGSGKARQGGQGAGAAERRARPPPARAGPGAGVGACIRSR